MGSCRSRSRDRRPARGRRVVDGGTLTAHKGMNLRAARVRSSADGQGREDAAHAVAAGADYLGLSFVRRAEDLAELRALVITASHASRIRAGPRGRSPSDLRDDSCRGGRARAARPGPRPAARTRAPGSPRRRDGVRRVFTVLSVSAGADTCSPGIHPLVSLRVPPSTPGLPRAGRRSRDLERQEPIVEQDAAPGRTSVARSAYVVGTHRRRHVLRRRTRRSLGTQHSGSGQLPTGCAALAGPRAPPPRCRRRCRPPAPRRSSCAQFRRPVRRVHTNDVRAGADQPAMPSGVPVRDRAWRRS